MPKFKIENKTKNLGKTGLKMWSQICGKKAYAFFKVQKLKATKSYKKNP